VAVRVFGPAEMVFHREDGILTDLSLASFTGAILELLNDRQLYNSMSRKALENAGLLSSSRCAEQMLASYEKLVAEGPRQKRAR